MKSIFFIFLFYIITIELYACLSEQSSTYGIREPESYADEDRTSYLDDDSSSYSADEKSYYSGEGRAMHGSLNRGLYSSHNSRKSKSQMSFGHGSDLSEGHRLLAILICFFQKKMVQTTESKTPDSIDIQCNQATGEELLQAIDRLVTEYEIANATDSNFAQEQHAKCEKFYELLIRPEDRVEAGPHVKKACIWFALQLPRYGRKILSAKTNQERKILFCRFLVNTHVPRETPPDPDGYEMCYEQFFGQNSSLRKYAGTSRPTKYGLIGFICRAIAWGIKVILPRTSAFLSNGCKEADENLANIPILG